MPGSLRSPAAFALLFLALAVPALSFQSAPTPAPAEITYPAGLPVVRIDSLITSAMRTNSIPGLTLALVDRSGLYWSKGYGMADLENFVPARPFTVYRLASVSKPITAVAVMQLVEQGRLDLDAPVRRYAPELPDKPWPVTVRQLLCHQGGVRNWTEDEFVSTRRYPTLAESIALFRDDPLVHEPGTRATYSSFGYTLLGRAIEQASGRSYPEYMRAGVFEPVGMEWTRPDDVQSIIPNRARGYRLTGGGSLFNSPLSDTSNRVPGGGLVGTAEDVGRFASAFMAGSLLKPETVRLMLTPQQTRDRRTTGFGLGFVVTRRHGEREAYHLGGQSRVSTLLYMRPDRHFAVVLLTNLEGIGTPLLDLGRQIADLADH
jgi:serine beta-lactamase-like protein LACTB, mitochondrial